MGGPTLEFINMQPIKGGPPLEFINIQPHKRGPPLGTISMDLAVLFAIIIYLFLLSQIKESKSLVSSCLPFHQKGNNVCDICSVWPCWAHFRLNFPAHNFQKLLLKVKPKTLKAESYVIIIVQNFQMIKKI